MDHKYLVIDKDILPSVYERVMTAKELLSSNQVDEVTEAVKAAGISRSTYYKYKDHVYALRNNQLGKTAAISFMLDHNPGLLSDVLHVITDCNANVLTINQSIPINNIANIYMNIELTNMSVSLNELIQTMSKVSGVSKLSLISIE